MKFLEYQIGSPINIPQNYNKIIFGDLHGNVIKLIDILLMVNMLEVKSQNSYLEFLTELEDKKFLDYLKYFNLKKSTKHLYLLGDCFGDRNGFEILKLKILTDQHNFNNNFTILFGNHDSAALSMIVNRKEKKTKPCFKEFEVMYFLTDLKVNVLQVVKDFKSLIKNHYKLCDLINNQYFLTHAPVSEQNILTICNNYFQLNIQEITAEINKYFQENIFDEIKKSLSINTYIDDFIWQRFESYDWIFYNKYNSQIKNTQNKIIQVTGHDKYESNDYIICLDNYNGKVANYQDSEYIFVLE